MGYTATEQANVDAMYQLVSAEAGRDWDTVYSFVADDCVFTMGDETIRGVSKMREYDAQLFAQLETSVRTLLGVVAHGDDVVFRWRADAVLAGTGKAVSWEGCSWNRMAKGKIIECWVYLDRGAVQRKFREAMA